jgi:hypothetical protein
MFRRFATRHQLHMADLLGMWNNAQAARVLSKSACRPVTKLACLEQ